MKRSTLIIPILAGFVAIALAPGNAFAIPAFTRRFNVTCSTCHVAMPYLNHTGREFKEAGYRMPDEDGEVDMDSQPMHKISNSLIYGKFFPLSARFKGYIVDKKKHKDTKIRPIHEIEILSGGNFWKEGSWFLEIETEDEDGFIPEITGRFGWHPSRAANIMAGVAAVTAMDPYNSLNDGHRLTVNHKLPLDTGADVNLRLRKDEQFIGFYGRAGGKFFYSLSYGAGNSNDEGVDPRDYMARVAYDITDTVMVGGFFLGGTHTLDTGDVDLTRFGLDFNLGFGDFNIDGMYMSDKDDYVDGPQETNATGFAEFFYTFQRDDRPFFVPLVRYEWREVNDGNDTEADVVASLGVYAIENVKIALEYWKQTDVPGSDEKIDRVTLFADVVF